jgi:hypothetical protein
MPYLWGSNATYSKHGPSFSTHLYLCSGTNGLDSRVLEGTKNYDKKTLVEYKFVNVDLGPCSSESIDINNIFWWVGI